MPKLIPTVNIVCEGTKLTRGKPVDTKKLPAGSVDSMVRLGQLVEPDAYEAENSDDDETDETENENTDDDENATNWQSVSVANLSVSEPIKAAIAAAGLETVGAIVDYGTENDGLTGLDGIGDASEKQLLEAITALKENG